MAPTASQRISPVTPEKEAQKPSTVELAAGETATVRIKFKNNHRAVNKIAKLLKRPVTLRMDKVPFSAIVMEWTKRTGLKVRVEKGRIVLYAPKKK